jgi:PKD repeat protein
LIFDISNPSSPVLKGSYDNLKGSLNVFTNTFFSDVSVTGNYAFLAGDEDLLIFDISNPSSPILIGNYSRTILGSDYIDRWMATKVLVSGNYVYVVYGHGKFSIFDISNSSSPFLKGGYDDAGYIYDFAVSADYVYIASYDGLHILKTNLEQTPLPIADFNVNTTYSYDPLFVQFTDISGNTNGWNWNFGDEATSNEQNPKHTYSKPGIYSVSLLVSNANGISYPVTKEICVGYWNLPPVAVENLPHVADFSTNVASGCALLSVQFTDLSKDAKWRIWYFGDGESSNETNPTHVYTKEGNYNVYLSASNENGTVSKNTTITVQNGKSSHTSSGSGGGGAGSSPESQSNVEIKELSQTFIVSGQPVKFDFPQKATAVVTISFDSKKTVGKTTTIAEMLKNKSTLTPDAPTEEVYKYLNIWVGNGGYATEKNIENAAISFKVAKS